MVLCGHDPLTGEDHRDVTVFVPHDAITVVDSVFAFRPEYNPYWEFRIWLEVSPERALARAMDRDALREGMHEALRLPRSLRPGRGDLPVGSLPKVSR